MERINLIRVETHPTLLVYQIFFYNKKIVITYNKKIITIISTHKIYL